eukprot:g86.t1
MSGSSDDTPSDSKETEGIRSDLAETLEEMTAEDNHATTINDGWGEWSECSAPCGGGKRTRSCMSSDGKTNCEGESEKTCNEHKCKDEKVFNFASIGAGAQILAASEGTQEKESILIDDVDKYLMTPCQKVEEGKNPPVWWFVIQLSEDIIVNSVTISHFEMYSSSVREFMVLGSATYPTNEWHLLLKAEASPSRGKESFQVTESWVRYLKFRVLSHHGDEFYCTLTSVEVHGTTALDGLQQDLAKMEQEVSSIVEAAVGTTNDGVGKEVKGVSVVGEGVVGEDDAVSSSSLLDSEHEKEAGEEEKTKISMNNVTAKSQVAVDVSGSSTTGEDEGNDQESPNVALNDPATMSKKNPNVDGENGDMDDAERPSTDVNVEKEEDAAVVGARTTDSEASLQEQEDVDGDAARADASELNVTATGTSAPEKSSSIETDTTDVASDTVDDDETRSVRENGCSEELAGESSERGPSIVQAVNVSDNAKADEDDNIVTAKSELNVGDIAVDDSSSIDVAVEPATMERRRATGDDDVDDDGSGGISSTASSSSRSIGQEEVTVVEVRSTTSDAPKSSDVVVDGDATETTTTTTKTPESDESTSRVDDEAAAVAAIAARQAEAKRKAEKTRKIAQAERKLTGKLNNLASIQPASRTSNRDVFAALTGQIRSLMLNMTIINRIVGELNKNLAEQMVRHGKLEERVLAHGGRRDGSSKSLPGASTTTSQDVVDFETMLASAVRQLNASLTHHWEKSLNATAAVCAASSNPFKTGDVDEEEPKEAAAKVVDEEESSRDAIERTTGTIRRLLSSIVSSVIPSSSSSSVSREERDDDVETEGKCATATPSLDENSSEELERLVQMAVDRSVERMERKFDALVSLVIEQDAKMRGIEYKLLVVEVVGIVAGIGFVTGWMLSGTSLWFVRAPVGCFFAISTWPVRFVALFLVAAFLQCAEICFRGQKEDSKKKKGRRDLSEKQHGIFLVINEKDYYKKSPSSKVDSKIGETVSEEEVEQMRIISSPELRNMSVNLAAAAAAGEVSRPAATATKTSENVLRQRRSFATPGDVDRMGAARMMPPLSISPSRMLRYQLQQLTIQADSQRNQWRLRRRFYETTNAEESRRAGVIEQEWENRRIQLVQMGDGYYGRDGATSIEGSRSTGSYGLAANDNNNNNRAVDGGAVNDVPQQQQRGARLMLFLDVRLLLKLALLVLILAQDGGTERLIFLIACACVVYMRQMRLLELMLRGRPPAAAAANNNNRVVGVANGGNAAADPATTAETNTVFSRFRTHFVSGVLRRSTGEWWEYMYDFAYAILGFVLSLIPTWRPHTLDPPPRLEMGEDEKTEEGEKMDEGDDDDVAEKRAESEDDVGRIESKRSNVESETAKSFATNAGIQEIDSGVDAEVDEAAMDGSSAAGSAVAVPLTDEGLRRRRLRHLEAKREDRKRAAED